MKDDTPKPELTGTYSIVTIQGTGEKAQYKSLSDSLIRGSPIFWHLCEKIHEAKRINGINKRFREIYKSKNKSLERAFASYEKEVDREFKKLGAELERTKKLLASVRAKNEVNLNRLRDAQYNNRKTYAKQRENRKELMSIKSNSNFFTKQFKWLHADILSNRVELMIRSFVGFRRLEMANEIDFMQFLYLCVGHQLDAFNKSHVDERFGKDLTKYFNRDINILIDKGYIRRFERRNNYYVTEDGKTYFSKTIKKVYIGRMRDYFRAVVKNIKM